MPFSRALPSVMLFISLVISCSGNPIYHNSSRSSQISNISLERRAPEGVTQDVEQRGNYKVGAFTIGNLKKKFKLAIDTGSCYTWVKKESLEGQSIGQDLGDFEAKYVVGDAKGRLFKSQITVGGSVVVKNQAIGVADEYDEDAKNEKWDGIIGLSSKAITDECDEAPDTVLDNLKDAGLRRSLGIFFKPTKSDADGPRGQITWGGYKHDGLKTTSVMEDAECCRWSVEADVVYRGNVLGPDTTAVDLDTGTSDILLAPAQYKDFLEAIGGTSGDDAVTLSTANYDKMGNLEFVIDGETYALTPNDLKDYELSNGTDITLMVSPDEEATILGQPFLDRYYVYLDAETPGGEVGIGRTEYTESKSS